MFNVCEDKMVVCKPVVTNDEERYSLLTMNELRLQSGYLNQMIVVHGRHLVILYPILIVFWAIFFSYCCRSSAFLQVVRILHRVS